jgi:hypothetical protein
VADIIAARGAEDTLAEGAVDAQAVLAGIAAVDPIASVTIASERGAASRAEGGVMMYLDPDDLVGDFHVYIGGRRAVILTLYRLNHDHAGIPAEIDGMSHHSVHMHRDQAEAAIAVLAAQMEI